VPRARRYYSSSLGARLAGAYMGPCSAHLFSRLTIYYAQLSCPMEQCSSGGCRESRLISIAQPLPCHSLGTHASEATTTIYARQHQKRPLLELAPVSLVRKLTPKSGRLTAWTSSWPLLWRSILPSSTPRRPPSSCANNHLTRPVWL